MADMKRAAAQTEKTAKTIESSMNFAKNAIKGFAAVVAVDALVAATGRAFDYADAIVDLSDKTGASTKSIQEFRYAAQLSGSSVEDADAALGKFTKNIGDAQNGSDAMVTTLRSLGVTSLDVDTALKQVIDGISKLPSKAQQNAAAMQLFGKSAGSLTYLLGQGSQGFDELARRADELGIVMGDDLLRNAGQVNDQLDTMKMILNAQMASAIVSNADAIGSMTGSLITLVGALSKFWSQDPKTAMSIMGGIAGFAAGAAGGLGPGAIVTGAAGAIGGYAMGNHVEQDRFARSPKWRAAKHLEDKATRAWQNSSRNGGPFANAESKANTERLNAVRKRARDTRARLETGMSNGTVVLDAPRALTPPVGGGTGGTLRTNPTKPTKAKTGPSAEDLARKEADRLNDYQREFARATEDEISARQSLTTNVTDQAGFERQLLEAAKGRELKDIAHDDKKGKLKKEEADALRDLVEQTYKSKEQLVTNDEQDKLIGERLAIRNGEIDVERDKLGFAQSEARSSKDRRDIALRIVDLEYQKEKLALEAIKDSKTATQAEKDIATARLNVLGELQSSARSQANRENQGPLGQYLDAIPRTAGELNDDMERLSVDGLDKLEDGLMGLVKGTESFGETFGNVVDSILDGLLKIALQQAIIKPLGSLLFGGDSSSGGGGLFGSIFGSIFKGTVGAATGGASAGLNTSPIGVGSDGFFNFTGFRANGGLTRPGVYEVGERGRELVSIGANANVIPNHALKGAANDNGRGVNINFGPITSNDPAAIRAAAMEAIAAAMPMIRQQSADHTIARLQRPRLR